MQPADWDAVHAHEQRCEHSLGEHGWAFLALNRCVVDGLPRDVQRALPRWSTFRSAPDYYCVRGSDERLLEAKTGSPPDPPTGNFAISVRNLAAYERWQLVLPTWIVFGRGFTAPVAKLANAAWSGVFPLRQPSPNGNSGDPFWLVPDQWPGFVHFAQAFA